MKYSNNINSLQNTFKKSLVLLIFLFSTILFGYSQDYISDEDGNWFTNGTWAGNSDPGSNVSGKIIEIAVGTTVTIDKNGATNVTWKDSTVIHVYGTLNILGYLDVKDARIQVHPGGTVDIQPDNDTGAPEVKFTGAKIVNNGTFNLDLGDVKNLGGSTITNTGTMYIEDAIENAGDITNTGDLDVTSIINSGDITNSGDMDVVDGITNSGNIDNSGTLDASSITNTGDITNSGTLTAPSIINNDPGDIDNTGGVIDGAITGDGDFTGAFPLPIELNFFNALSNSHEVVLNWQTATEENNDYFSIERSTNGIDFEEIGHIIGAGNSSAAMDYSYTDYDPIKGISYYRLKQTDYNGDNETFNMVSVNISDYEKNTPTMNLKISNQEVTIQLNTSLSQVQVELFDNTGRLISKDYYQSASKIQIQTNEIPLGIYIVRVSNNAGINLTEKIQIR